jgi:hypothetical protein
LWTVLVSTICSAQKIVESTSTIQFYNKSDGSLLDTLNLNNMQQYQATQQFEHNYTLATN